MIKIEDLPNNTQHQEIVGVNFKDNPSLSERYEAFLTQSPETDTGKLFVSRPECLIVPCKTNALRTLEKLSERHGFTRCAGKLFAANLVTQDIEQFSQIVQSYIPANSRVRLHCFPAKFTTTLLDTFDESKMLKDKGVTLCPTSPTHLLTALCPQNTNVYWGLYTDAEYRQYIARPGDGNRDYVHDMNFNKAQGKIAEALQMLKEEETNFSFGGEKSLVVDVGAAPGGWTQYLAGFNQMSVIAIDPGEIDSKILQLGNVKHIRCKAEDAVNPESTGIRTRNIASHQEKTNARAENISNSNTTITDNKNGEKSTLCEDVVNANSKTLSNLSLNKVTLNDHVPSIEKASGNDIEKSSPLEKAGKELCGSNWRKYYRLLVCDANLDVRDSVRELVTPLALCLAARGVAIITLKLGRRVGKTGVIRKTKAVADLMESAGFDPESFRVVWLFSNSKNERTFIARKF